ncbi:MAG: hypothetical protein RMJ15_06260 [Nitrososphaerota archaeon]|nr:hypothetical protein [Candidatus Bathyarchaeota archaeon]MDW8023321.1 hypothetical protein [Nitrososphaerota archaeon]
MYALWVKVDDALPWLELEGNYETRKAAEKAAKGLFGNVMIKIVRLDKECKAKALVKVK